MSHESDRRPMESKLVGAYNLDPAHYNEIPDLLLQGEKTVLEFGCATGLNQIISRHRDFFLENNKAGRYLGIDLEPYEEQYLNIQQGDIRSYQTEQQFDVVIAMHVLEHIELHYWQQVCDRLMSFVAPHGVLIIGTPHKEPINKHEYHLVFEITADMIRHYLPDAEVHIIKMAFKFNEDGASFIWSLLRYIKRLLTRHPYVMRAERLVVIWRREQE